METCQASCQLSENISQNHYLVSRGTKAETLFVTELLKIFHWLDDFYIEDKLQFIKKKKKGKFMGGEVKIFAVWLRTMPSLT